MITIDSNRKVTVPVNEKEIGYHGDNKAEKRVFSVPLTYGGLDLTAMNFKLDCTIDGKTGIVDLSDKTVTSDAILLTWEILENHLQGSGMLQAQVRAFADSAEKWQSGIAYFNVKQNINATSAFPSPLPSEFETMEANVTAKHVEVVEKTEIAVSSAASAELSATNAYESEVNAKASETASKTSEDNAKTSETNASNSASTATTQANMATTKASEASTSATNAANSATSASNSASTATTKASEASTSATNAANSASQAAGYVTEITNSHASAVKGKTFTVLDDRLEDIEKDIDTATVDTKTGTSIQSTVADDYVAEITKIEGAYIATKPNESADVSPGNVAIITFPNNFVITSTNSDSSKSNTYTVANEIRKLPNGVYDTIEKKADGKWYHVRNVGKIVLNGAETWIKATRGVTSGSRFYTTVSDKKIDNSGNSLLCDKLKRIDYNPGLASITTVSYVVSGHSSANTINIASSEFDSMTVTQFKAWLSSNPITVYYELTDTVSILINDVKLTSYNGVTNVSSNANPQVTITATFKSRLANAYSVMDTKKANATQEAIITPTFTNSWVTNSTAVGYYKNSIGKVEFVGSIKNGVLGSSAFTLPVGYRPSQTIRRACVSNGAFGYLEIGTDGTVKPYGNNTYIEIGAISFRVDA